MHFSVIIPLYNKEAHIGETIRSVLAQTFRDFELLVVDDGSTDRSLKEARSFENQQVTILTKTNGGTASARNAGIKKGVGDHFCFLDGDDLWLPGFLQQVKLLIDTYPGAGLYGTAYSFQRKAKRYHPGHHGLPEGELHFLVPDYFESVLHGEQVITASSACIPRPVLEDVGFFNEKIRHTEDQEMWNRIAMKYPVAFHTEVAAIYRQDAQNMKTRHVPKKEIEYAACLQQQLEEGLVPKPKVEAAKKIIAANLIGVASLNLLAGDKKTARKFLSDPRASHLPERKAAWEKLMPLPPFVVRALYRFRNKIQHRR